MSTTIKVGDRRVWPNGKEIEVIEQVTEGQFAGEFRYRYLDRSSEGILDAGFLLQSTRPAPTNPSTGAVTQPNPAPVGAALPSLVELDRREATPRERAMASLADQEHIPWAGHRLPENWDAHADGALSAAADLPGLASVSALHHMKGGAGNPTCVCGWTPDWTAGPWIPQFDLHLAAEIRTYLTGGAS